MKIKKIFISILSAMILIMPEQTFAHAFGQQYTLPVPLWLYLYGGAATLIISFVLIGIFMKRTDQSMSYPVYNLSRLKLVKILQSPWLINTAKFLSVLFFILTIVTGIFGSKEATLNFNMNFFWIIFMLGFMYLTFFIGDIWPIINPLKVIVEWIERLTKKQFKGVFSHSPKIGYLYAFGLYFILIWFELVQKSTPLTLSLHLLEYMVLTFIGVIFWGKENWFTYFDFLSVFFRLIGKTSTIEQREGNVYIRPPFAGLLKERGDSFSLLLFILLMLSSTAFDGFSGTGTYYNLYLQYLYPVQAFLKISATTFESILLFLTPFLFLLVYIFFLALLKIMVRTSLTIKELALQFSYSILPIALAYNVAHYYTLFLVQGQDIIRLISDPFGKGWDLFHTAHFQTNIAIIGPKFVWNSQVILIVIGHIVAVYIAHIVALGLLKSRKKAIVSQIPMLLLMMIYTMAGLWILAQPLTEKAINGDISTPNQTVQTPSNPNNISQPPKPISPSLSL